MANKRSYTGCSKYHAKKTVLAGIMFDSKAEAKRYAELLLMQRAGKIHELERQKPFELQPSFKKHGKTVRAISYEAEFVYADEHGNTIVEDTKGVRTEAYKIKRKLFEYKYPDLTIREVTVKR